MEMDQQRRMFIAMALMLPMALMFAWYSGSQNSQAPQQAGVDAGAGSTAAAAPGPSPPEVTGVPAEVKPGSPEQPAQPQAEVKQIVIDRESVRLVFSTRGAALVSAELKGEKTRDQLTLGPLEGFKQVFAKERSKGPPMDLAIPPAGNAGDTDPGVAPLSVAIRGPQRSVESSAVYRVQEGPEPGRLRFTLQQAGYEVEKDVRWSQESDRDFAMTVRVKNVAADAAKGELQVSVARGIVPETEEAGSFFGGVGNQSNVACLVDDDLLRLHPEEDKKPEVKTGKVSFVAIDQQYFASVLYPLDGPQDGHCEALARTKVRRASAFFPLELKPGEERTFQFGGYAGPKDLDLLSKAPERMAGMGMKPGVPSQFGGSAFPHLDKLVDYGLWAAICRVLLGVLKFFHSLTANWGVAIILLTLMVKVALLPLSIKAMSGMEAMKKLQPRMEEIRKKYAEDRERQQLETMKLYQEAKVNPVGGCLPLLVQIPIWIALFTTLRTSYELYREPFISPIWADLTFRDPTYLLPVFMGVTWVLTQRAQPQMVDPIQ
ncbi:MAG TPA: membrane protein insertase YidC, partial [Myxococcales bacterium]|nr:membrane protein insertase YidC [Myxococcales bacterium]